MGAAKKKHIHRGTFGGGGEGGGGGRRMCERHLSAFGAHTLKKKTRKKEHLFYTHNVFLPHTLISDVDMAFWIYIYMYGVCVCVCQICMVCVCVCQSRSLVLSLVLFFDFEETKPIELVWVGIRKNDYKRKLFILRGNV